MRRFEFSEGSSDKFWQVRRDGTTVRVQFGRIGSPGQIKLKACATEAEADRELAKLVAEKTKKGYREVAPNDIGSPEPEPEPEPEPAPAPPAPASSPSTLAPASIVAWTSELHAKLRRARGDLDLPARERASLAAALRDACTESEKSWSLGEAHADADGKACLAFVRKHYAAGIEPPTLDAVEEARVATLVSEGAAVAALMTAWVVRSGLLFAVDALAAMADFAHESSTTGHLGRPSWIHRVQVTNHWAVYASPAVIAPMAALAAEADPVARSKAHARAAQLRSGGSLALRVALACIFRDSDWADADARDALALPHAEPGGARLIPLLRDAALLTAMAKRHPYFDPVLALAGGGADAGPALALHLDDDHRRADAAEALAAIETVESARSLATILDKRAAAPIARAFYARRPDLAMLALAPIVASRSKLAVYAEPILKTLVRAHPALPSSLTGVDAKSRAVLERLSASEGSVAASAELPSVLVTPPWEVRSPKRAAATLPLTAIAAASETKLHFQGDEQERTLAFAQTLVANYRQMAPVGPGGKLPPGERTPAIDAWGRARIASGHTWNVTALLHLMTDDAVLSMLATGTAMGDPSLLYLLARFGERALPFVIAALGDDAEMIVKVLGDVESSAVAMPMAIALSKKRWLDAALAWMLRFPEAAALGLVPVALGSAKKERVLASAALSVLAKRRRDVVLSAAGRYGAAALSATTDLLDVADTELPDKMPALPDFFDAETLTAPRLLGSDHALPALAVRTLGSMLQISTLASPLNALEDVASACDPPSLAEFAWGVFQAWLAAGAAPQHAWAFNAVGLLGDDECARRLTPLIRAWPGESQHARAVIGLDVLAAIGSDVALMFLHGIAQKLKFKGLQEKAREKMLTLAEARGLTAAELADRLVPDLGLDDDGTATLDFGSRRFKVGFDPHLAPFVLDAAGKRLAELPKPAKSDDPEKAAQAVEAWKTIKKDAKALGAMQVLRLEMLMCEARRLPASSFRLFFVDHPLLIHLVRRLVWGVFEAEALVRTFRVAEDRTLADVADAPTRIDDDATVGLVHRLELDDATAAAWSQVVSDYELIPPFDQLGRATYAATADEQATNGLKRVEGVVAKTSKVLALAGRGWRRGAPQDGGWVWDVEKALPGGLVAELAIEGGLAIGMMSETPPEQKLGALTLRRAEAWAPEAGVPFGLLSRSTFSELIRDLESLRD